MIATGLFDKNGNEIFDGDMVSLEGNITADNSFGSLPNGWVFTEKDVYRVYWDTRIENWSLEVGLEPNTRYNQKFLNHSVSLLHGGDVEIIK